MLKREFTPMYDTGLQLADVPRRKAARSAAPPFAASRLAGLSCGDVFFGSDTPASNDINLGQAVESKKRDNAALGETLVRIGLLEPRELSEIRFSQAAACDLVGSLTVASAIRTRLGEILLREKRITSSQLEHALELQRQQGGKLGEILVGLGWLDKETLDEALATQAAQRALRPE
jgi:hypothetical protein